MPPYVDPNRTTQRLPQNGHMRAVRVRNTTGGIDRYEEEVPMCRVIHLRLAQALTVMAVLLTISWGIKQCMKNSYKEGKKDSSCDDCAQFRTAQLEFSYWWPASFGIAMALAWITYIAIWTCRDRTPMSREELLARQAEINGTNPGSEGLVRDSDVARTSDAARQWNTLAADAAMARHNGNGQNGQNYGATTDQEATLAAMNAGAVGTKVGNAVPAPTSEQRPPSTSDAIRGGSQKGSRKKGRIDADDL